MTTKTITILFIGCLFIACKKKEEIPVNGEIDIAPSFQPYVDQFVAEASVRGIAIDFSDTGLKMYFRPLSLGTAAQCQELGNGSSGSHQILFDENLWAITAPARKEFLVFHELGHCELGRQHVNTKFPNGEWQSMMQGRIDNAPLSEKEQGRPVNFYGFRKSYYLDELFGTNPNIPSPTTNYELEITVNRLKTTGDIGLKYGTLTNSYLFTWTEDKEVIIALGGQTANEIDFFNRGALLLIQPYRLYYCNDLSFPEQSLTFTIRQQDGIASFFLAEQFLYQVDAFDDTAILVGALQENENLKIERFKLSTF